MNSLSRRNINLLIIRLVYVIFAFDSMLKVPVGFKVHVGVLFVIIYNFIIFILGSWHKYILAIKENSIFLFFVLYVLLNGLLLNGINSFLIFVYLFLAFNVFLFFYVNAEKFGESTFKYFQWVMIVTGLFQFLSYKLFNWQINFMDTDHYNTVSSFAHRLRGFFIEPNWFAISFGFNTKGFSQIASAPLLSANRM